MNFRRISVLLSVALLTLAGLLAAPNTRGPILSWVGQQLIADESRTGGADIVVVAIDAGTAGLLEAADLVRDGAASRVATFTDAPSRADLELRARGVPVEDRPVLYRRQLEAMGVVSIIPTPPISGTVEQGRVLPGWCEQHGWNSVIVVTSWHHSRRAQRLIARAMEGHPTRVQIRVAQYSDIAPDTWWHDRNGARTVIIEALKLLIDLVRHPFS